MKKISRRSFLQVAGAAVAAGALSACSVSTSTGASTAAPAGSTAAGSAASGDAVEISWMFWDDLESTEDLITKGFKAVVDRFNETYAGQYHCTPITTNLEEYYTKLNALVAAGQTPDVFTCSPGPNTDVYVTPGVAADLTDILNGDEKDWYDSFAGGMFERVTYDGKIYSIPIDFAAACVYYNTEIFAEVGVEPPETYTDMLDVCQKIKDAGYTPISCSAGTAWCLSMIAGYLCDRQGGPDNLEGINAGTLKWSSDTFVAAVTKLKELSQYFQDSAAGDSNDQATANFYNGDAAMLVQGSWAIGQINGNNPDFEDKCGVFRFPGIEGGADPNRMIVKTDNFCMSSATPNPDACIALLKCFTDDTAEKYYAEVGGKIPTTNVAYDQDKAPKQLAFISDILKTTTGTLGFYNECLATTEAGSTFDDHMVSVFLGDETPEEALAGLDQFYDENGLWTK